jgi:hypothetical protein
VTSEHIVISTQGLLAWDNKWQTLWLVT